ncbi:MAG: galactokinase [Nakamurella sp.]
MTATPPNAAAVFRSAFGASPAGTWSAPGRANLIGEHTDYSGGLVLPFAIDSRAQVAVGPATDGQFHVVSAQRHGTVIPIAPQDLRPESAIARTWQAYPLGVVWAMRQRGIEVPPLRLALDSSVPAGAGLSSSAAVECAVALAISDHLSLDLDLSTIARIAQQAENDFVGMPCGLMDQMASAASIEGHALYFDIGADMIEHIPFDTAAAGLTTMVIDTRAHHSLADGEYAKRRADVETAARMLDVGLLSEVLFSNLDWAMAKVGAAAGSAEFGAASLLGADADVLQRRVRHVLTENQRVREAVALLRAGYIEAIGAALSASHESLRDDFEVSCAELDLAAEAAEAGGALGARMVGGGFGGSVIALAHTEVAGEVGSAVIHAFSAAGYKAPVIREVSPAAGAHRDS